MNNLINLDFIGDIGVNLTNKLADATGWIVNKGIPKRVAVNTYIKDIQDSNLDPLTKAALISKAKKIIKEYINQQNIVEIAISALQKNASPNKVDDDWLGQFMDKARLVSSKEFQLIWGKILARECNDPGSIPLVLLHTLEKMDRNDAEAFTALCKVSIQLEDEYSPVIIGSKFDKYEQFGITLSSLIDLSALGLIQMDLSPLFPGYSLVAKKTPAIIKHYDAEYEFDENTIEIGNVIFTKSGTALMLSIDTDKIEGFFEEYCLPFWQKKESKKKVVSAIVLDE